MRFNKMVSIDQNIRDQIEQYFNYRWLNDKTLGLTSEQDSKILDQLPFQVTTRIFKNFLYFGFIQKFKMFFVI